jgi:hypothetical protein
MRAIAALVMAPFVLACLFLPASAEVRARWQAKQQLQQQQLQRDITRQPIDTKYHDDDDDDDDGNVVTVVQEEQVDASSEQLLRPTFLQAVLIIVRNGRFLNTILCYAAITVCSTSVCTRYSASFDTDSTGAVRHGRSCSLDTKLPDIRTAYGQGNCHVLYVRLNDASPRETD